MNIETWFLTYKGLCEQVFGTKKGEINFPDYGCQAEMVYDEMILYLKKERNKK